MELSKLKHIQHYITSFQIALRQFERSPQSDQLKYTFDQPIELIFEAMETDDISMTPSWSIIDPIVNRNFGNTFHNQNGPS